MAQDANNKHLQRSSRTMKQLLGMEAQRTRRLRPPLKLGGLKKGQGLSRDEALWFLSLPDKAQKQFFTKEEQILLKAACELALLDLLDESYWSYGNLPNPDQAPTVLSEDPDVDFDAEGWDEELVQGQGASSSSSPRLPIYRLRGPERYQSYGRMSGPRHSLSNSSISRNFSLPFRCMQGMDDENDDDDDRVDTWLADTVSATTRDSKVQFYQDPETRMKLRRHITTPQAFDEAVKFGFHMEGVASPAKHENVRACSSSSTPSMPSHDGRATYLAKAKTPSMSYQEPGSPASTGMSDVSIVTPTSPFPKHGGPLRITPSTKSMRPPERDVTIRMTLTKPELRSTDEEIYALQQKGTGEAGELDPWALEQLPFSDDVTGKHGAFSLREKEDSKFRKVWQMLGSSR